LQRSALSDVTLTVDCGSRVALVGHSGSGKSTLADLLMGLLDPDSGEILIDGMVLTPELRRRWRRSIAHVPQSIFLADATVAQNIAMGVPDAEIDEGHLAEAVRVAQLEDVIAALPDGLETSIGEQGVRLSGGQRQRIGIARAVYKNAPVLVLDEATSSLDETTEAALIEALSVFGERRTMIVITHRASAITHCDRLLCLDNGRLDDSGPIVT
jgi:ABC-type multidrug transport system fused ATPase/permease subunit